MDTIKAIRTEDGIIFWNLSDEEVEELAQVSGTVPEGAYWERICGELSLFHYPKPPIFKLGTGRYQLSDKTIEVVDVSSPGLRIFESKRRYLCSDVNCVSTGIGKSFNLLRGIRSVGHFKYDGSLVDTHFKDGKLVILTSSGNVHKEYVCDPVGELSGKNGCRRIPVDPDYDGIMISEVLGIAYDDGKLLLATNTNKGSLLIGVDIEKSPTSPKHLTPLPLGAGQVLPCGRYVYVYSSRGVTVLKKDVNMQTYKVITSYREELSYEEGGCLGNNAVVMSKSGISVVTPVRSYELNFDDVTWVSTCKDKIAVTSQGRVIVMDPKVLDPLPSKEETEDIEIIGGDEGKLLMAAISPTCDALALLYSDGDGYSLETVYDIFSNNKKKGYRSTPKVRFSGEVGREIRKVLWDTEIAVMTNHGVFAFLA